MSAYGEKLPIRDVRRSVAVGGRPDMQRKVGFGSVWPQSDPAAYASCRVLPQAPLRRIMGLAAARTHIAGLGIPTRLEKGPEAVVAQKLPLATSTSALGRRVTKALWGWLFSTATNSVR